jgi:hypothetical protein
MGAPEVEAFLTRLATDRQVAASTQNQALAALLFLYRVAPISKTAALAGTSNRVSEAAGVPSKLQESPRPVEERAQPNLRVIGGGPGVDTIGDINPEGLAEYNAKHGIDHKPDVPKVRFLTPFENEGTPNQTGPAETSTKVYTPPVE